MASCLICSEQNPRQNNDHLKDVNLLWRELKAVFVLRQLLRLPPEKLEGFLERSGGDHPHQWITFCDPCQLLVEKAFSLFEQLNKVKGQLRKVQQKVILKVKESESSGGDWIAENTRDFVKHHDYGAFENPFVGGDWEAEWRAAVKQEAPESPEELECDDLPPFEDPCPSSSDNDDDNYKKNKNKTRKKAKPRSKLRCEGGFQCPHCPITYRSRNGLWVHVQRNHNSSSLPPSLKPIPSTRQSLCPYCQQTFAGKQGLSMHKRHYHPTELAQELRDKPQGYQRRPYNKGEPLTCPLCGDTFLGRRGLHNHKRIKHPESCASESWPCAKCPLTFPTHHLRRKHVREHHKKLPFRSPVPPEQRGQVKRWRLYARRCPHCPDFLGNKPGLEAHMKRVHEGQHPLHCEFCGKGASTPQYLAYHQAAVHFICRMKKCGVRAESAEGLYAHHLEVHGGEANLFKCDQCGKFSETAGKRERHLRQAHRKRDEKHVCELCGKSFPFVEYLQNHVRNSHKKQNKVE